MLTVLCGATFMSFAGVMLRNIDDAGTIQVLIYRCFALGSVVPFIAMWRRGTSLPSFFRAINRNDWILGCLLATSFSCYIYSILNTTVANTLFVIAVSPFIAAVVGWLWIGERVTRITVATMLLALFGVALMVVDGLGTGHTFGNLMALAAAASFAVGLVFVRKIGSEDMLAGTFLGGWIAAAFNLVLALALGQSLVLSPNDLIVSLGSGVFSIGIGMALVIWGASYLPAAEVSILTLLEGVLGPIWVWLVFTETVTTNLLIGGAIVFAAVTAQVLLSRSRELA